MKADEIKGMLDDVTLLLSRTYHDDRDKDIAVLSTIWNKLNQHRREMVAAEKCVLCHHRECIENSSLCAGCHETVTRSNAALEAAVAMPSPEKIAATLVRNWGADPLTRLASIEERLREIEAWRERSVVALSDIPLDPMMPIGPNPNR